MRKSLTAVLVATLFAATAGTASAALIAPSCPEGYVGVVVDNHNVCTNLRAPVVCAFHPICDTLARTLSGGGTP